MSIFHKSIMLGGTIKIADESGTTIATFDPKAEGFRFFAIGLSQNKHSLFNQDTNRYDIGTIDELGIAPERAALFKVVKCVDGGTMVIREKP